MGWSILYLLSFKHHWPLAMIQLNCVVASTAPTVWLLKPIPFRFQYWIWTPIFIQPKGWQEFLKEANLHGKIESALLMRWYSTTFEQSWKNWKIQKTYCFSHFFFNFVQIGCIINCTDSNFSCIFSSFETPALLGGRMNSGMKGIFVKSASVPRHGAAFTAPRRGSSADILWMTWRVKLCLNSSQVRNLSFDQESFHKICLRAAFSRQLKSSFPLLTQKEFGEGDNFPKRVGSSHGG